jgi:hypothetical protein
VTDRRGDRGARWAVFLVALGTAWAIGNVGATVDQLSTEFDISLATVGLLSGTIMLGFSLPGTILAAQDRGAHRDRANDDHGGRAGCGRERRLRQGSLEPGPSARPR